MGAAGGNWNVLRAAATAALLVTGGTATGQDCLRDAMLVFDGSGSMSEVGFNQLDEPRIHAARRAVREAMPMIAPFRPLGLLVYGPGPLGACDNIDLRFAPVPDAGDRVIAEIDALRPAGDTPLTAAVAEAARVLDHRRAGGVVVLVTDGKETCGGSPCALAAEFVAEAPALTVHVIGFKVRGDFFDWEQAGARGPADIAVARCLADRTGGQYASTESVQELAEALRDLLGCAVIGRDTPPGPDPRPRAVSMAGLADARG